MALLSKLEILAANDLKFEDVDAPEWGGTVRIQAISGAARDSFEDSLFSGIGAARKQDLSNVRAKLVACVLVDENGNRIFTDADVMALGAKSASALGRCFDVAQRLNGMSSEIKAELGNVSDVALSDGSISA